ncbi:DUF2752 domain-containing protein [uncultured Marixanthomonas sp.]|uniref:DUF2752 domain-containing protein n=1 Tax=uncultured Marixanthomonas sp. TaxID=757245 RepID=UPI0030DDBE8E|tara:strand:+ start:20629 stop:20925 length:297 start_codon:yes stop_codon:yes gene_type:complete
MALKGIEDYMLQCTSKQLFGIECLGCGTQRATVLFFRGEFAAAFHMYPAIYTLIVLLLFVVFNLFVKFKHDFKIKVGLLLLNVAIIVISYFVKMRPFF